MSAALIFALFVAVLIIGALLYLRPEKPMPLEQRDHSRFLR